MLSGLALLFAIATVASSTPEPQCEFETCSTPVPQRSAPLLQTTTGQLMRNGTTTDSSAALEVKGAAEQAEESGKLSQLLQAGVQAAVEVGLEAARHEAEAFATEIREPAIEELTLADELISNVTATTKRMGKEVELELGQKAHSEKYAAKLVAGVEAAIEVGLGAARRDAQVQASKIKAHARRQMELADEMVRNVSTESEKRAAGKMVSATEAEYQLGDDVLKESNAAEGTDIDLDEPKAAEADAPTGVEVESEKQEVAADSKVLPDDFLDSFKSTPGSSDAPQTTAASERAAKKESAPEAKKLMTT